MARSAHRRINSARATKSSPGRLLRVSLDPRRRKSVREPPSVGVDASREIYRSKKKTVSPRPRDGLIEKCAWKRVRSPDKSNERARTPTENVTNVRGVKLEWGVPSPGACCVIVGKRPVSDRAPLAVPSVLLSATLFFSRCLYGRATATATTRNSRIDLQRQITTYYAEQSPANDKLSARAVPSRFSGGARSVSRSVFRASTTGNQLKRGLPIDIVLSFV